MLNALLFDLIAILAFGGVGITLMALRFVLVEVLTPGKLGALIWSERNTNAAVVLSLRSYARPSLSRHAT